MTCREFAEFLMEYFDGGLGESERSAFEAHLEACPPCVNYLASYRETVQLGKLCAEDAKVPEDVPDALVDAILAARKSG